MSIRKFASVVVCAGSVFSAEVALAQDAVDPPDGARFRGAVSGEGGAIVIPDATTLGIAGVQAQLGVQINHLVGLYAVPQFDIVFGEVGGVHIAGAVLVDFSIIDEITIGVGPEAAVFAAIGNADGMGASAAGGALYGGRLHLGFQPVFGRGEDGIRRKALSIGIDARFLHGAAGIASVTPNTVEAEASTFVFSPMLTIGYQAF